jgi:ketosteroid isomerase-like protein
MEREILDLNQRLLNAIVSSDYETYADLCADDITCIEPESNNQVVSGKMFHKFYFDMSPSSIPSPGSGQVSTTVSMSSPHVRVLANNTVAVIAYVRLNQSVGHDGKPTTTQCTETRVWEKQENGKWAHSHFHKS